MSSHLKGPSNGEWSVFAEKVVEQRDALREEVAQLRLERDRLEALAREERTTREAMLDAMRREALALLTLVPHDVVLPERVLRRIRVDGRMPPFFSEAFLYEVIGKEEARTVLSVLSRFLRAAGCGSLLDGGRDGEA